MSLLVVIKCVVWGNVETEVFGEANLAPLLTPGRPRLPPWPGPFCVVGILPLPYFVELPQCSADTSSIGSHLYSLYARTSHGPSQI